MGRRTGYGRTSAQRSGGRNKVGEQQTDPFYALLFLLVIGLFSDRWFLIAAFLLGFFALIFGWMGWESWQQRKRNRQLEQRMLEAEDCALHSVEASFAAIVAQHLPTLARKRSQLLIADEYGVTDDRRWSKERDRFVNSVVLPALSDAERRVLAKDVRILVRLRSKLIDRQASCDAAGVVQELATSGFSSDLTGREFELWCADTLRRHGWKARPTSISSDQGADVIAEAPGHRVVIQCKLYSRPVGNKAVQEVHSAKMYYGGTAAAVVSALGYTQSAKSLAAATGVLLLDKSDLPRLRRLVAG